MTDLYSTSHTPEAAYLVCKGHPLVYTRCEGGSRAQFYFPPSARLQRDVENFYDRHADAAVQPSDYSQTMHALKASAMQAVDSHRRKLEIVNGNRTRRAAVAGETPSIP